MGITDGVSLLVTHVNLHYFQDGHLIKETFTRFAMKAYITLIKMCSDNMAQHTHAISFHISLPPPLSAATWPAQYLNMLSMLAHSWYMHAYIYSSPLTALPVPFVQVKIPVHTLILLKSTQLLCSWKRYMLLPFLLTNLAPPLLILCKVYPNLWNAITKQSQVKYWISWLGICSDFLLIMSYTTTTIMKVKR